MNVASLELCKELYELSGWNDVQYGYLDVDSDNHYRLVEYSGEADVAPAYDLGYLLRKLNEARTKSARIPMWLTMDANGVGYSFGYEDYLRTAHEEMPENAAAMLAIALFKQGILTKTP